MKQWEIMKRFFISFVLFSLLYIVIGLMFERGIFFPHARWLWAGNRDGQEAIKESVVLYNKIYSDLYASDGQMLRLDDFPAVKRLRHELYRDLDFLRERKRLLIYDMANLSFLEIKRPSSLTAEVVTYEEWNYLYQKSLSRELAESIKGTVQGFKHYMRKQEGRWIVVDSVPADIKPPEEKNEFPF